MITRIEQLLICRDLMEKSNYPHIMLVNISDEVDHEIN